MQLLYFLLVIVSVVAELPNVENGVYVLNDNNLQQFIESNEFVLVEFYAPWCGHCKKLEPEYAAAAKKLESSNIKLAKVDATESKELAGKYGVTGYPTLKFIVKGVAQDYEGERNANGIVSWLLKKTQPPVDIDSVKKLEELQETEGIFVLGLFNDLQSENAKLFMTLAKMVNSPVGTSTAPEVRKHLKINDDTDQVILLKNYDNLRDDFDGQWTLPALQTFVSSKGRPLITPFNEQYQRVIFSPENKRIAFLVNNHNNKKTTEMNLNCAKEVAKKQTNIVFVDLDSGSPASSRVLDYFGLSTTSNGDVVIFEPEGNIKYQMANSLTICDGLENWVSDYLDGKIERTLKKQKTPEDWDAEYVKVLTAYNFHDIAMDKNKHVFVKFYAPWCGHCKSLEPIWKKLAKYFNKRKNLVFAKVDATLNEIPEISIQSYPTLKFFPQGSDEILDYSGERDYKNLKAYVLSIAGQKP